MATTEPEPAARPPAPSGLPGDVQGIPDELRALVSSFADTSPDHMRPQFYAHAFNDYDIAIRALWDPLAYSLEGFGR